MATYGGVDILGDCWGFDIASLNVLTDEQLVRIFTTPLQNGKFLEFCWGYAPLPGNSSSWDITGPRMRAIADMTNGAGVKPKVLIVQHCRKGSWTASDEQGAADGQHAAEYAAAQDYTDDCHLAPDDESLKNPGPDAIAHFTAWCSKWTSPCVYEGFAPGMTPDQEYDLPDVTAYWGAYGPWNVSKRGVRCRQGITIVHAGVSLDPDHASPDNFGGVLRGYGRLPDPPAVTT